MDARALMTTAVVSITPDAGLNDAASLMVTHGVNALPVLATDGSVVGVVGIKDVLRSPIPSAHGTFLNRYQRLDDRARTLRTVGVDQVMARQAVTVGPDASAADVAATMVNHGIHPLLAVEDGQLLGVNGRADVVRLMLGVLDGDSNLRGEEEQE